VKQARTICGARYDFGSSGSVSLPSAALIEISQVLTAERNRIRAIHQCQDRTNADVHLAHPVAACPPLTRAYLRFFIDHDSPHERQVDQDIVTLDDRAVSGVLHRDAKIVMCRKRHRSGAVRCICWLNNKLRPGIDVRVPKRTGIVVTFVVEQQNSARNCIAPCTDIVPKRFEVGNRHWRFLPSRTAFSRRSSSINW
jgi:hypothetical protein